ncbi:hypothetical protein B296_00008027 [Ensete ventricosum]|uniref:Uncharacterized protein n=1 Tax=Ensete ventricosum TaxID=4639 RepID=A0A427B456_ENSVE|nr:hypothetical protein B296_00008027 [Ensete ventricosum]
MQPTQLHLPPPLLVAPSSATKITFFPSLTHCCRNRFQPQHSASSAFSPTAAASSRPYTYCRCRCPWPPPTPSSSSPTAALIIPYRCILCFLQLFYPISRPPLPACPPRPLLHSLATAALFLLFPAIYCAPPLQQSLPLLAAAAFSSIAASAVFTPPTATVATPPAAHPSLTAPHPAPPAASPRRSSLSFLGHTQSPLPMSFPAAALAAVACTVLPLPLLLLPPSVVPVAPSLALLNHRRTLFSHLLTLFLVGPRCSLDPAASLLPLPRRTLLLPYRASKGCSPSSSLHLHHCPIASSSSCSRILLLPPSQVAVSTPIFLSSPPLTDTGNLIAAKSSYIYDICP